jgi:U3 small nucleolar RNA-associated protein 18
MKDANRAEYPDSVIQSSGFHSNGTIFHTGSLDKKLRLYAIDGVKNQKISSIYFDDMPISSSGFINDSNEILLSGRRPFLYSYNLEHGSSNRITSFLGRRKSLDKASLETLVTHPGSKFVAIACNNGEVIILDAKTKQVVSSLKQTTGSVRAMAFSADPTAHSSSPSSPSHTQCTHLLTAGSHGEVFRWDLQTMKCVSKFTDQGSQPIHALATTYDGKRIAVGSKSGVVNIYDSDSLSTSSGISSPFVNIDSHPTMSTPIYTSMHLTTPITHMTYSHDGQILAFSSQKQKDAMKLLHTKSQTVFSNWPTSGTPLHYVSTIDFSPNSGYLTIGNDKGKVLLYRLHGYQSS